MEIQLHYLRFHQSRILGRTRISHFIILASILLLILASFASGARLDHGSPCSQNKDCENRNVLLTCVEGVCTCPVTPDSNFILDADSGLCSAIIGSSCHRSIGDVESFGTVRHYVPCIRNSTCSRPARVCECDRHHYPSEDKKGCPMQKDYGEACKDESHCDIFRYFTCSQGNCGCSDDMEYNPKLNTCFKPIGSNCTRENVYNNPTFPGRYDACPINAECYNVCNCRSMFRISSDGSCQRDHGSSCGPTRPCSDIQFVCRNQKCSCKYPLHQVYDSAKGQCLSRVPGPCNVTKEEDSAKSTTALLQCVENAKCVPTTGVTDFPGQCRCGERYRQDKDGFCLKPHGYDCELDRECSNIEMNLACINNQCACPDLLQEYDRETDKCVGKVGSRCLLVPKESATEVLKSENSVCVQRAHCKPFGSVKDLGVYGECVLGAAADTGYDTDTGKHIAIDTDEDKGTDIDKRTDTVIDLDTATDTPTDINSKDTDSPHEIFTDEEEYEYTIPQ